MTNVYVDALKMLGRRELSEAQVRQRLARREHAQDAIDTAVARLREERAIDDLRTAAAIARTETLVKRRGKLRVRRQIEQAGIQPTMARQVVDQLFAELDPDGLLDAALARRLHGREQIADEAERRRLYRFLIGQGFEADRVIGALGKHTRPRHEKLVE